MIMNCDNQKHVCFNKPTHQKQKQKQRKHILKHLSSQTSLKQAQQHSSQTSLKQVVRDKLIKASLLSNTSQTTRRDLEKHSSQTSLKQSSINDKMCR